MENVLKNDWEPLLAPELKKEYYLTLSSFLTENTARMLFIRR